MASSSKLPSLRLLLISLLVSFGASFHFGYQLVITNPSQDAFLDFVNASLSSQHDVVLDTDGAKAVWSIVVSQLSLGAIIGCLLLPVIADNIGRKRGLYLSSTILIAACIVSALSKSFLSLKLYAFGRFTFGLGVGVALGLAAIYLSESSPKPCRGFVSTTMGVVLQVGIICGSAVGMPMVLGVDEKWPLIYWVEIAPLAVLLLALPFLDESPSFLVSRNRIDEARRSIRRFHRCTAGEADKTLEEIRQLQQADDQSLSLIGVFRHRETRRGTLVACLVGVGVGFSGIAVVNAFVVQLFRDAGLGMQEACLANVGVSFFSFFGNVVSSMVVDRFGRRPLLLLVNAVLVALNASVFALLLSYQLIGHTALGYGLIAAVCAFIFFFGVAPGPIVFFIAPELVAQNGRSAAQSWATITQMAIGGVCLAIYLPLSALIGPYIHALLFTIPLALATLALYFYLPETKNRDLREVQAAIGRLPRLCGTSGADQRRYSTDSWYKPTDESKQGVELRALRDNKNGFNGRATAEPLLP